MEYKKYFTMSYDDGLEQDKKLIGLLKKYGLKCTFNLNSGLFGEKRIVIRAGDIGFALVENKERFPASMFKGANHHIIPKDEIAQVYEGLEVATHGLMHSTLPLLKGEALRHEIIEDMNGLSEIVGYKVTGHAYPGGAYSEKVIECLRDCGITYARTVKSTHSFSFPQDPYRFNPTCQSKSKDVFELLDQFINAQPDNEDMLFCLWGHGYEFDFGTERSSWTRIEKICEKIAGHDDIVYCTNGEAFDRQVKGIVKTKQF